MITPPGFYSAIPTERAAALKCATSEFRDSLLAGFDWPTASPGSINAWLVFIGPSPGASPGEQSWNYDPRPAIGGPHPGVSEYKDKKGFWNGIRDFTRAVFPELSATDGYSQTMLRNLDPASSATAPKGGHMPQAALNVLGVLDAVIKPRLVVSIGGAREYTDPVFMQSAQIDGCRDGILYTSKKREERRWIALSGTWSTGEHFLYVSPSGIHPSITHVSRSDSRDFLGAQSVEARRL